MIRPVLVAGVLVAGVLLAAAAPAFAAGDAERGETLWESRCFGCHSMDANRVGPLISRGLG